MLEAISILLAGLGVVLLGLGLHRASSPVTAEPPEQGERRRRVGILQVQAPSMSMKSALGAIKSGATPDDRCAAVRFLHRYKFREVTRAFAARLRSEPDWIVRARIVLALFDRLEHEEARAALAAAATRDPRPTLRRMARALLQHAACTMAAPLHR